MFLNKNRHSEIQDDLPFSQIKRTMIRWRDKAQLPEPTTFTAMHETLNTEEWEFLKSYSVDPNDPRMFEVKAVSDQVMLIYDTNFIRDLAMDKLYISTTTRIVPNIGGAKYLTFVVASINEYVSTRKIKE